MLSSVAALQSVKDRIHRAAERAARDPGGVTLVAVSKTFSADDIYPVLAAGHRVFGENRVQEARAKWPALRRNWSGIELHLIGPLQTNKAVEAVALFDVIQTIDRPRIAAAVAGEMRRQKRQPGLFVQVNTGDEQQKAGISLAAADSFIESCRTDHDLEITGLMCIPPNGQDPSPHFDVLQTLAARHGLTSLSMGMSGDFELAVTAGATHVRVGSAIFGVRG